MLVEIGIHISVRILHTEFLLDIGCPRHERLQFFVGWLFFPGTAAPPARAGDSCFFFAGLTEPGPLHIGKDLIHMLQLPPQLVIFRFQFQDGFFQCGPFGSGICGFLCGKDGFFVFRVNYQRLKKGAGEYGGKK